jgi:purine/pyrimidine-nucleoside phosphorylase
VITVNEYFEGKVKSLVVHSAEGKKTVGVIQAGEYEFNTDTKEIMTVILGTMSVYLPEYEEWEDFGPGSSFSVPEHSTFKVNVTEDAAYLCEYQ